MHVDSTGIGPGMWVLAALGFILLIGALAIVVDSLRRPRTAFGRAGRWPWIVLQAVFFGMTLYGMLVTPVPALLSAMSALTLIAVVQQVAYLLRVVFPSPKRASARSSEG